MSKFALIGNNISYSKSKEIHELIKDYYNLDLTYELLDIRPNKIKETLELLKNNVYQGFNVTKPYKETIIPYLDKLTKKAKKIGAVNTIYFKDGLLVGDNTDYDGIIGALKLFNIDVRNKNVYIFGNGGAAKAIYIALLSLKARVTIVKREDSKRKSFGNEIFYKEIIPSKVDLFINTTTVGTFPNVNLSPVSTNIVKNNYVIDLIYNPKETKLLKDAKAGFNGLPMLLIQAIKSESIWLDKDLPFDVNLYEKLKEVI